MKIAFTATGKDWDAKIDPRFGRTDFLLFYDDEKDEMTSVDNRDIMNVAHGAGPKTAQHIYDHAPQVLITGNGPGGNAASILSQMDLKIFVGAGGMTVREAYEAYKNNQLSEGGSNAQQRWNRPRW
ncbi:MAG: NifB/NifX family molybdenum-iron cluster-binding protein [Candidatus Syntrophosphaera sp.]